MRKSCSGSFSVLFLWCRLARGTCPQIPGSRIFHSYLFAVFSELGDRAPALFSADTLVVPRQLLQLPFSLTLLMALHMGGNIQGSHWNIHRLDGECCCSQLKHSSCSKFLWPIWSCAITIRFMQLCGLRLISSR